MIRIKELPKESYVTIIEEVRWKRGQGWVEECIAKNLPIDEVVDLSLTLQGLYYWLELSKKLEAIQDKKADEEAEVQRVFNNYENGLY